MAFHRKYSARMILILNDQRCDTAGMILTHTLRLAFGMAAVNSTNLEGFFDILENNSPAIIILPEIKGETNYYPKHLTHHGKRLIHSHVNKGAMYAGFCAGAYNACSVNRYQSPSGVSRYRDADQLLALTPIEAKGTLPGFGKKMPPKTYQERGHSCEKVPLVIYDGTSFPAKSEAWYENGPYFHQGQSDVPDDVRVLARYRLETKLPVATFVQNKGHGKLLLSGVLPYLQEKTYNIPDHPLWALIKNEMSQHLVDFKPRRVLLNAP